MKRVIIKFMSHGKKLLAPNMSRTVHSLQGRTCPIFLKNVRRSWPRTKLWILISLSPKGSITGYLPFYLFKETCLSFFGFIFISFLCGQLVNLLILSIPVALFFLNCSWKTNWQKESNQVSKLDSSTLGGKQQPCSPSWYWFLLVY